MAKEMKFEQQMKRLQDIVDRLEKEDIDLDESLSLYEEGLKLSKTLKEQLNEFEKKIAELNRDEDE